MSGGAKVPKTTTTITKQEPPDAVKPYLDPFMAKASSVSSQPFVPYGGKQVAPLTGQHLQAVSNTQARALQGSPIVAGAQDMLGRTMGNEYLNYGMGLAGADNPWQNATGGRNALLGMNNPYLQEAIGSAQDDVLRKYRDAVMPQFASMDRASGSFGNSGLQQMKVQSQGELARELGNISNSMRMQDYGLQANLGEGALGREQTDLARNAQLAEAQRAALMSMYGQERGAQMQGASMAPQLAEVDYRDMQALLGAGDVLRDYQQQSLTSDYNDYLRQQQWPYQQLDVMGNAIARTMGAGGTTTQTAPNPYQPSRTASAIGGGALGYGAAQAMNMASPWMGGLLGAGAGYMMG